MVKQNKIPTLLSEICSYLQSEELSLSKQFADGRINASINEDELIKAICRQYRITIPKSRAWYDFAIEENGSFSPVNIKVTDTTHADNLNCKLGIYYALTGLFPSFPNETSWLNFFEQLYQNLGTNKDKDYYFLIFNKSNNSDVFCTTLKGLQKLQANGNNLPFQCKWDINRDIANRSFEQTVTFLLSTFGESIKLRAEIYFNFKKYFPQYV
jgi:hypothetical protein